MGSGKVLHIGNIVEIVYELFPCQRYCCGAGNAVSGAKRTGAANSACCGRPGREPITRAKGAREIISTTGNTHSLSVNSAGAVKGNGAGAAGSAESDRLVDVAAAVGSGNSSVGRAHSEGDAGAGGGVERAGTTRP